MTAPGLGPAGGLRLRPRRGFGGPAARLLKVLLLLAAVAYVALVFNWHRFGAPDWAASDARAPGEPRDGVVIEADLVKVRLLGRRDNVAYRLTADTVERIGPAGTIVALTAPAAAIRRDDGAWARVHSRRGVFDRAAQRLRLEGAVVAFTSRGHELRSPELVVDLAGERVRTSAAVQGSWPGGAFRADGGARVGLAERSAALFGDSRVVWTGRAPPSAPLPKPPPLAAGPRS